MTRLFRRFRFNIPVVARVLRVSRMRRGGIKDIISRRAKYKCYHGTGNERGTGLKHFYSDADGRTTPKKRRSTVARGAKQGGREEEKKKAEVS